MHGELHLRPWEIRKLRIAGHPNELELALDAERYSGKKPPPGETDVSGPGARESYVARRRSMTALDLLNEAKRS